MFNPEPPTVTRGRRFLYDASISAPRRLGVRDLSRLQRQGRPVLEPRQPGRRRSRQQSDPVDLPFPFPPFDHDFQPMKGPLATQSLRGMANHGPMHWRGDRTGSLTEPNIQPDSGAYNEREALRAVPGGLRRPARAQRDAATTRTWRRSSTSCCRSCTRRTRSRTSTAR